MELKENARPESKKYLDDISEYDNVFVCGPCWWGDLSGSGRSSLSLSDLILRAKKSWHLWRTREMDLETVSMTSEKFARVQPLGQALPFTAQSVEWGKRGARLNDIAPGISVTPLAIDEFNGPLKPENK